MIKKNLGPVTAYALAVKNGFEGTESEWLESLKGTPEWSLVQNKPVEYESIGDTITWDGNEEGKIACSFPVWFLIAPLNDADVEKIRANPELFEQGVSVDQNGIERGFDKAEKDVLYYEDESVVIILKDNLAPYANHPTMSFPYKGVYFYSGGQSEGGVHTTIITASFTVPGFDFHKEVLKPDYVPYAVMTKPQSLTEQQQMQARKNLGLYYTEGGIVEILPETTIEGMDDSGDGVPDTFMLTQTLDLVVGKTYVVKYNGVDYECVCQDASALVGGIFCVAMGDMSEMGLSGDGEPFMLLYSPDGFSAIGYTGQIRALDNAASITLAIYNGETIHKLDNKYIDAEWMATTKKVKGELIADNNSDLSEYPDKKLEKGKKYTVTWDGVDYDCVGLDSGSVWNGCVYLGNLAPLGGAGNGEPFLIIEVEGDFEGNHTLMVGLAEGLGSADGHTFAIFTPSVKVPVKLPAKFLPTAASVDMTAYESEGKIVETYPDGSEVTTTIEFDGSGNPVKITDSFGNVTELAW